MGDLVVKLCNSLQNFDQMYIVQCRVCCKTIKIDMQIAWYFSESYTRTIYRMILLQYLKFYEHYIGSFSYNTWMIFFCKLVVMML